VTPVLAAACVSVLKLDVDYLTGQQAGCNQLVLLAHHHHQITKLSHSINAIWYYLLS
jgi:hypothetical protein